MELKNSARQRAKRETRARSGPFARSVLVYHSSRSPHMKSRRMHELIVATFKISYVVVDVVDGAVVGQELS